MLRWFPDQLPALLRQHELVGERPGFGITPHLMHRRRRKPLVVVIGLLGGQHLRHFAAELLGRDVSPRGRQDRDDANQYNQRRSEQLEKHIGSKET